MNKIIFILPMFFIVISCDRKSYFYSPDEKKCITFIEHENNPYYFYVVPGKWDKSELPTTNYLIVEWSDVKNFEVNWETKKYRIAYPGEVKNCLDTSIVDYSWWLYDEEIINVGGEKWRRPPIEGFLIGDIIRGNYIHLRKKNL